MSKSSMVLLAVPPLSLLLSAQSTSTIRPRWDPKTAILPKYDWLYAKSIPAEARSKLMPLYQEADNLLQERRSGSKSHERRDKETRRLSSVQGRPVGL